MLCDTCQRQGSCLPSLLAKGDQQLQKLLEELKRCEMRIAKAS